MNARIALPVFLLVGACSAPAAEPIAAREISQNDIDAVDAATRPAFALNEVQARDMLATLGAPWNDRPFADDTHTDSLTDGYIRTMLHRGGSTEVLTLPDAKVWRVELRTGAGERCGKAEILLAALPKVLAAAAPDATVDASTMAKLSAALKTKGGEEVDLGNAKVSVSGGCVSSMYVTAA